MMTDGYKGQHCWQIGAAVAVLGFVLVTARFALGIPSSVARAFDLSVSFASGIAGDLVVPVGSASTFAFDVGKVAIGDFPGALSERSAPRRRGHAGRRFLSPMTSGPRARLLLIGVVDADASLVTNSGNQLIIDAVASSGGAALSTQPFTFAFDINAGVASLDVPLPIPASAGGSMRLQIVGVSVVDPNGQAFATLGFEIFPPRPPAPPGLTPHPTVTADGDGRCFRGPACSGPSVPMPQEECCRTARTTDGVSAHGIISLVSWCPPDQLDPATGQCTAGACQTCEGIPTPTPGPCANLASCGGACSLTCADGTVVSGQCAADQNANCQCTAVCSAPTPCGIGECFDTITSTCTGQPCDGALHCPLPNQLCDVGGRRCPCQPTPPLPQGHICCQCKERAPACFDFSYVEVQPICPPGCDTFLGQECDRGTDSCVPLAPCTSDQDCDDGNGCTVDHCTAAGCTHDCVCVGPGACLPGPATAPR